jgi:hypothetical protein
MFGIEMNRYRHFDNEFDINNSNSAAILPEIEIEDPFPFEFNPQLHPSSSKLNKFQIFFLRRTCLERYLFYTIILLLIILFILILIFLSYHKKMSMNSLCLTPTCIEISHALSSGMNQSVDPCEDFHEFVCGRWIRTNIIPKGYSSWSTARELIKKNLILLKNLLEQTSISSVITAEQEAMKFYQSCMNLTELERLNIQPLEKYFQENLNFTLKQWIDMEKNQTWEKLFVSLIKTFSKNYTIAFVLPIKIQADEKNSTWNNIYVRY